MKYLSAQATPGPWEWCGSEVKSKHYNTFIARRIHSNDCDPMFIANSRTFIPNAIKDLEFYKKELEDQNNLISEVYLMLIDCYGTDKAQNEKIAEIARKFRTKTGE